MKNERHGNYDDLFVKLETIIGQEISCIYSEIGNPLYDGYKGTLTSVIPYDCIVINGNSYYFIGERHAIAMLGQDIDGVTHELYRNNNIHKEYRGYFRDPIGLIQAQEEQLGYSVQAEELGYYRQDENSKEKQKVKTHN